MSADETGTMAREPARAPPSRAVPGLVLVYAPEGARAPHVIALADETSVAIGREPPPGGVVIDHLSVSRVHARLQRHGAHVTLADLNSRNGVFVRGQKIASAELTAGDDVRMGDALFVFIDDDADLFTRAAESSPHPAIAAGPRTRKVLADLPAIAKTDLPVLVLGETGTGKELVAEAVHALSKRSGALATLNCAAIPASLVESELFGFKKGAFTGADRDAPGLVKSAAGGTLFLDEIGDLPLETQAKFLRLLESKEITPLGTAKSERVDVRVVCATHADLAALVAAKRFRADLFSRIRGYVVTLPPLRTRKEDLAVLVRSLLARLGRKDSTLSAPFMVALVRHDWPFNVRELFGVLRRAVALAGDAPLDVKHLPDDLLAPPIADNKRRPAPPIPAHFEEAERPPVPNAEALRAALTEHRGNVAALARVFKRDRSLIHRWLKQHGLEPEDFRED